MTFCSWWWQDTSRGPKLTYWMFSWLEFDVFSTGWIMLSRKQKSCCIESPPTSLHTYQNGSHYNGPVLGGCAVIADLLIRERHKSFIFIPVASLERADIWLTCCLFLTQKVLHEIQMLSWNKTFFLAAGAFQGLMSGLPLSCHAHQDPNPETHLHPGDSHPHLTFTGIL